MSNVIPQSETAVAARPAANNGLAAFLTGGRAETAKALAAAVSACQAVAKADRNDFHKYQYASADSIIEEGRKALAGAGLALLPLEASLNGSEREGSDRFELVRTFALLHVSGEITPLRVVWPVCPEKGRPLDKATAAADTLSLAYLLRDLLLMNRVDPSDEVNARGDRHAEQRPERPREQRPLPADGAELEARLVHHEQALVAAGRCQTGELIGHVCRQYAAAWPDRSTPPLAQWDVHAVRLAVDAVRAFDAAHKAPAKAAAPPANDAAPAPPSVPAKVSAAQVRELLALLERKNRKWGLVVQVFELPRLTMPESLTPAQYAEIVKTLNEEPDAQPAKK